MTDLGLLGNARIPPPRNILVSYHYYKRVDLDKLASCRIVADSGAFSAKMLGKRISTAQLAAWTKTWDHRLCWVAALDTPSRAQTRRNWLRMVNDYQLPAVSTLHAGDEPSEMDWYAEQGVDFLGLGGVAGQSWSPAAVFRWLVSIFKYAQANHPQMRFHGWGMTHRHLLRLPFFSVDSSGWGSSYRYGRIMLRHPVTGQQIGVELDGKGPYETKIAEMLVENYGVKPSEVAKAGPHNRLLLVKLSALSASVQEQQWRTLYRNHPITPPKWGHLGGWTLSDGPNQHLALSGCGAGIRERKVMAELHGPHIHLVDGHPGHIQVVADLAREAATT